jgi:hypothetical protein
LPPGRLYASRLQHRRYTLAGSAEDARDALVMRPDTWSNQAALCHSNFLNAASTGVIARWLV